MSRSILGLDIRDEAVSVVAVRRGIRDIRVEQCVHVPVEPGDDMETGWRNALEVVSGQIDLSSSSCAVAFPADRASYRNIRLPFKNKKKIRQILPFELEPELAIMDFFPGVELYEGYGSTEAGIVTVLKPEDQLRRLGSIGFETLGTDFVKILDEDGNEVAVGEVGELYSRGPMLFDEYYKLPEKTAESFKGGWFSAGDLATRDEDGFYQIVDRKDNMIITGGENVYPSDIEEVIGNHECVFDCAVVGLPDDKWGEKVAAVIIRKPGLDESKINEETIRECCKSRMAGFKRPKEIIFIDEDEMPRTPTGKILHRKLREKFRK